MPCPISSRVIGKVNSPGVLLISASQIVPLMRALASRLSAGERTQRIVEAFRLDHVELRRRHPRLHAERNAGGKPAAGRADDHDLGLKREPGKILDDFSADGALARQ